MRESRHEARAGAAGAAAIAPAARGGLVPVRFLLLFLIYVVAGNVLFLLPPVERAVVEPWTLANAGAAAAATRALGYDARSHGSLLAAGDASLAVMRGCNGIEAIVILVAAVFAYPAAAVRRFVGVALGAVVIFGFNIVRLVNLLLVAVHFPARLEFFHVYVWQTLIVLVAFGWFLVWGAFLAARR